MTKHDDFEGKMIDYLLGELDEAEAREVEAVLDAQDPAQAQQLAEYQALTAAATRALAETPVDTLSEAQRTALLSSVGVPPAQVPVSGVGVPPAQVPVGGVDVPTARAVQFKRLEPGVPPSPPIPKISKIVGALAAASILIALGYALYLPNQEAQLAANLEKEALQQRIAQLPRNAERFLITDINNAAATLPPTFEGRDLDDPQVRQQVAQELERVEMQLGIRIIPRLTNEQLTPAFGSNGTFGRPGAADDNATIASQNRASGSAPATSIEYAPKTQAPASPPPASAAARRMPARPTKGATSQTAVGGDVYLEIEEYDVWATDFRAPRVTNFERGATQPPNPMTQEKREQLQALGYMGETNSYAFVPERAPVRPQPPTQEQYQAAQEQQLFTVAQQPLSTFSVDVDTASYTNIRRMLNQGQWPPADAVRIEEMINYFGYNYPQPSGEHPFGVGVDLVTCPWAPERVLARVGLQGKEVPRGERPAANLVFLLDVSGSMDDPNKLPLVRESMKTLLDNLQGNDRVGIVTYASGAQVVLPSTSCDARETIQAAIDSLTAGGSTNGQAGIGMAYAMARENFIEGGINRVILATDGDFNVGATDAGSLLDMIAQQAQGKIFLTALGYGMGNLKDGRLEELSNKGNGNYAYIDTYAEARKALAEQVNGTLMTIAKDVKIQVEFNPGRVQAYRLIGYDNRVLAARDFNDDTKDAGEIGAGHRVTALYEIVPVGAPIQAGVDPLKYQTPAESIAPPAEPSGEWMTVKLRYKQPEGSTSQLIEVPVTGDARDMADPAISPDLKFASAVAAFGLVLRDSQYKGSASLDMALALARQPEGGSQQRQEFLDLVVRAKTLRN